MFALLTSLYILVGTYTGGESDGVYVWKFDSDTAQTTYVGMTRVDNPSYLTASADGKIIYAVTENEASGAAVNALRFDTRRGELVLVDTEDTGMQGYERSGGAPCHVATNGRLVATANYLGGEVSVFGVDSEGLLSAMSQRLLLPEGTHEKTSHMHCVRFSPDGKFLFATDLGTDKLLRWNIVGSSIDEASLKTFDVPALASESLSGEARDRDQTAAYSNVREDLVDERNEASQPLSRQRSGPRHFIFGDDCVFLINEYSGTVVAFDYNGGDLVQRQVIDADPADGRGSADIVLSPDGRFLYASNRLKNDGVAIFSVSESGTLDYVGYKTTASHPRNIALSPDGRFMLVSCKNSDVVQVFAVDAATGALTPTQQALDISQPSCVLFVEAPLL